MKPIQSLHINYFKFFANNDPIKINGKHVLLYGENGSGKSSIYWALYTLLEAVYKTDAEINKYFMITHDDSLVNLHAKLIADSFVSLELSDRTIYRIGYDNSYVRQNSNAEATLRGSDFMNYRFMFKISDHRHHDEIDLFPLFEKEVFPYVKTTVEFQLIHDVKPSNDFNEIWEDLKIGVRILSKEETSEDDKNREQKRYADKLRAFVDEINFLAQRINTDGNQILQEDLEYDGIRFEITCIQEFNKLGGGGDLAGKEGDFPVEFPKIKLQIPEYNGLNNAVKKPQSFLNEAKLTAIGISIRFAILGRRLDFVEDADFQLLVMDDLLISLDMSNRRKVLDMLLNKYADNYQLFILTHDRGFFEKTKRQIYALGKSEEWVNFEMYEDTRTLPSKPFIKKSESFIENATKHFLEFEFPAAANSLRKACEELITLLLPSHQKYTKELSKIWQLDNLLGKAEVYYKSFPVDYQPISELREHLKILLNPLSHSELESPIYRNELKDVFKWYEELLKYKELSTHKLLDSGEKLVFSLKETTSGDDLSWEIELLEDLNYRKIPTYPLMLSFCKFRCFWSKNSQRQIKPIEGNNLIELYKDACRKTKNESIDIFEALSKANGTTLKDIL